jgi:hypothetical protein
MAETQGDRIERRKIAVEAGICRDFPVRDEDHEALRVAIHRAFEVGFDEGYRKGRERDG